MTLKPKMTIGMTVALALAFLSPAVASGQASEPLAIVGGRVFPSPDTEPIEDGVIVLRNGRIAAVGPRSEVEVPADAEVIDASGGSVMAGFWNAHVHFTEPVWMGADTLPAGVLADALREMFLQHGFVHVLDTGSALENTVALRRRIESGEVPGPGIRTAGAPFVRPEGTPIYVRPLELPALDSPAAARDSVRARLAAGVDAIKLFTGSPVDWETPPVLMDEAVVAAVTETAHEGGALVVAHPQSADGVRAAVDGGVDLLAHTTPATGAAWDPELVRAMVESGIALAPTLKLWVWELERSGSLPEVARAFQEFGVRQLADFARAGGRVVFGTDVGYMADHDPVGEYRLMAEAGLDFEAILAALTTAPAELLGEDERTGRLEPRTAADLVVVDGRPDQRIEALGDVRVTIREGTVVFRQPSDQEGALVEPLFRAPFRNRGARDEGTVTPTSESIECDPIWDGPLFGVLPGMLVGIVYGASRSCGEGPQNSCSQYFVWGALAGAGLGLGLDALVCSSSQVRESVTHIPSTRLLIDLFSSPDRGTVVRSGGR